MSKYRMKVKGMTCTGCEIHVAKILAKANALNIEVNYVKGEVSFELADKEHITQLRNSFGITNYKPGVIEELQIAKENSVDHKTDFDLLIIGSGSAAFSAAIKAAELGAKVGMIERNIVGGTCVNFGCVPSKTLLRAGEINSLGKTNAFSGIKLSAQAVDLDSLMQQKNELVNNLRNQKYVNLIDEYGIQLIIGAAKFISENQIKVADQLYTSKRFLIATGASPLIPKIKGLESVEYLTSTTLLNIDKVPKRLLVIGSGYIGVELGLLYHNLGSEVILMQRSEEFLKEYDFEVSESLEESLIKQGIKIIKGVSYERVEQHNSIKSVHYTLNDESFTVEGEQLLVATGRNPNTSSLDLEKANVKTGVKNEIIINELAQTSNPDIYAAGDVTLNPQFVYVAAYMGRLAAENAIGEKKLSLDLTVVPSVIFSHPSLATVGLTEKQAKENDYNVITSVLKLGSVPRALVNHDTDGVIKLVADANTRKILGVHIVSENAGEVIYAATLVVKFGLTIENLKETLAPYLTMAEGLKLAALTFDKDISKLSCCAG
ncbi:MAG: mercury(II) reductase [Erysipelotrichaceae bacterium]|nr:mercury(II) reductase [Erysipelotrichaceae bacterium]